MGKKLKFICFCFRLMAFAVFLSACDTDQVSTGPEPGNPQRPSSSEVSEISSSSSGDSLDLHLQWVQIPSGLFIRGVTTVRVSAFQITATEITQKDYEKVMGENPSLVKEKNFPVSNMTWHDAARFCNALSKMMGLDSAYQYTSIGAGGVLVNIQVDYSALAVRLPTEAEWEYAVRAGTSADYYWGNEIVNAKDFANYQSSGVVSVGSLEPNGSGLYDMAGNVEEWCSDWYGSYSSTAEEQDPTGPPLGSTRVVRGGSWQSAITKLKSGERSSALPSESNRVRGFRVVKVSGIQPFDQE